MKSTLHTQLCIHISAFLPNMNHHHAIVLPLPFQGHINPLFILSNRLSQIAGFTITFVNNEANHSRILQSLTHNPSSLPANIRFVAIPDGLPSDHKRDVGVEFVQALSHEMCDFFEELVAKLIYEAVQPPVTCIIYDIFMPVVAQIAKKYGLPSIAFFVPSAASFGCHYVINRAFSLDDTISGTDISDSHLERIINTIPGVPLLKWTDVGNFLQSADPSDFWFNFMLLPFKRIQEPSIIVVNSCEVLEDCSLLKELDILSIGPMLPSAYPQDLDDVEEKQLWSAPLWQEDMDCLKWLDKQAPASVIYVSYGSLATMSVKQVEEFAMGLEATGMPVLWVLRRDTVGGDTSRNVAESILSKGGSHYIVSWAPQPQVLSHASIAIFLTHGGWNATVESIAQGIPMVCLPLSYADWKLNVKLIVEKWKIGVMVEADEEGMVGRSEVEKKVRCVLQEKAFRERAAQLKRVLLSALKEEGSKQVKCLVERITNMSPQIPTNAVSVI